MAAHDNIADMGGMCMYLYLYLYLYFGNLILDSEKK